MSFPYFAYGSNLWLPQLQSRCPSARVLSTAHLDDWALVCDKPSVDGSAKFNIRPDPGSVVTGVVYEIDDAERSDLDVSEPRYRPIHVELSTGWTLTYTYEGEPHDAMPFDWYVAMALAGAADHGLPSDGRSLAAAPDPVAPGVEPASPSDIGRVQAVLSAGLRSPGNRYFAHPGEYGWWVHHDDPRRPGHFSTWLQGDDAFVVLDSVDPREINVFARPGVDRMPLIRWSQRRLGGAAEVGWVSDTDDELTFELTQEGYRPVEAYRSYEWDLTGDLPDPEPPPGWSLRSLAGEHEADARRRAAHAAFESTMPEEMHLQRYLDFMRSSSYVPQRDLVAIAGNGTVSAFMVWWADDSGVAQIEPFGTDPEYQRMGLGRALLYHGLHEMKRAGMIKARVCTDDDRPATAFYEGVGFADVGRLRWWAPTHEAPV